MRALREWDGLAGLRATLDSEEQPGQAEELVEKMVTLGVGLAFLACDPCFAPGGDGGEFSPASEAERLERENWSFSAGWMELLLWNVRVPFFWRILPGTWIGAYC